jgi:hypothetical protein
VPRQGGTSDPTAPQVKYSNLAGLGWEVNVPRTSSFTTATGNFWSVLCNNFGKVTASRTDCTTESNGGPSGGAGEVHVRYDCSSRTFWVLAYVYDTYTLSPTKADMWAINRCTASGRGNTPAEIPSPDASCDNGNTKFLQVRGPCDKSFPWRATICTCLN